MKKPVWNKTIVRCVVCLVFLSSLLQIFEISLLKKRHLIFLKLNFENVVSESDLAVVDDEKQSDSICFRQLSNINLTEIQQHVQSSNFEKLICVHKNKTYCANYFLPRNDRKIFKFDFVIKNEYLCTPETDIIIFVHSRGGNSKQRQAIRDTWGGAFVNGKWPGRKKGSFSSFHVQAKLFFITGLHDDTVNLQLKNENDVYHDIVQGNFWDTYANLTLKTLTGFEWIRLHCSCARYVIKADDDMFLNVPHLLSTLYSMNDFHWKMWGALLPDPMVWRIGKWNISVDDFPFVRYHRYLIGATAVIDAELMQPLVQLSQYFPFLPMEDVYFYGTLPSMLNVTCFGDEIPHFYTKHMNTCSVMRNWTFVGSNIPIEGLYEFWDSLFGDVDIKCPDKRLKK